MGGRSSGSSPWMIHHTSGSQQGHPRYTGAVTTGGRGWAEHRPKGRRDAMTHHGNMTKHRSTAPSHCGRYRSTPHGVLSAILPVRRSTCSFKLICSSPGFAVLNQSHFSTLRSRTRSWHLVPTPQICVHGASLHLNLQDCCAA